MQGQIWSYSVKEPAPWERQADTLARALAVSQINYAVGHSPSSRQADRENSPPAYEKIPCPWGIPRYEYRL